MVSHGSVARNLAIFLFFLRCFVSISSLSDKIPSHYDSIYLNRTSFPPGFVFGTASASYQYEGAWNEDGRGPSIWDVYTHTHPERITDGSNGDVAIDQYHRYKEDVGIMKDMNADAYRLSISWSRLLPNGKLSGGVNQEGVQYYNNLIKELLAKGLKPYVTIFHWDLPQPLQDEYNGFLSRRVVRDLRDFAELCFREFGDRVKHWITLNEPHIFTTLGYARGISPPGRCSAWQNLNCLGGDSATEPYIVAHNLLLSHGAIVKLYKEKYQAFQKGLIGLSLDSPWFVPYSKAKHNRNAALRALDFVLGWFMEPVTYGEYPHSMRVLAGNRLAKFTKNESELLKGSLDFLGLNYYTANYAQDAPQSNALNKSVLTDSQVNLTTSRNGILIGAPTGSASFYVYPKGLYELLVYIKRKYKDPVIYITENEQSSKYKFVILINVIFSTLLVKLQLLYLTEHDLILFIYFFRDGVKLKGFFAWSLLDNFEWASGYTIRFGINFVDYKDNLKRYRKHSSYWFEKFLKK
ncbi:hypothetical protein UlMin_029702 [Ulmus minor]